MQIYCSFLAVGPVNVKISGPNDLKLNIKSELSCESEESVPPAEISWTIKDFRGNNLSHLGEVNNAVLDFLPQGFLGLCMIRTTNTLINIFSETI